MRTRYNSKLKEKQTFEIEKQVEKAKILKAGQAKKSEYGDSSKYVTFKAEKKKCEKEDAKIKVKMNKKQI